MLAYERGGGAIIGVVVTHCAAKLPILRAMAGRSPHHAMRGKNLEDESSEAHSCGNTHSCNTCELPPRRTQVMVKS